jgi:glycosyltransferase involved in cell wall biosynthesis
MGIMAKITFLVSCYNHENSIDRAIESIVLQKHQYDFEILVSDDGSDDKTVEKIEKWIDKYPKNIKLFIQPRDINIKYKIMDRINSSLVFLFNRVSGDYFCLFDGDDYCVNKYFAAHSINIMEKSKNINACVFDFQYEFPDKTQPSILADFNEGIINDKKFIKTAYVHSGSFMFRNILTKKRITALASSQFIVDNIIVPFLLQFGKLYYIRKISYSYTVSGGFWTSLKEYEQNLFTVAYGRIIERIASKYKWCIYSRILPYMQKLFVYRKSMGKEMTTELYSEYYNISITNNDIFLQGVLSWKDYSILQKIKFMFFYKYICFFVKLNSLSLKVLFALFRRKMMGIIHSIAFLRRKILKFVFGRSFINSIAKIDGVSQNMTKIDEISQKLSKIDGISQKLDILREHLEDWQLKSVHDKVKEKLDAKVLERNIIIKHNTDVLVTVLMPIFNEEKTFARALESVLMQKTNFSYLIYVIDDGSTDNSLDIVKEYNEIYPGLIKIDKNENNSGLLKTLFKGYGSLKTKYWTVLDGDDFWLSNEKIQKAVDFLESHPDFTLYGSNTLVKENDALSLLNNSVTTDFDFTNIPVFLQTSSAFFRNFFEIQDLDHIADYFGTPFAECFKGDTFRNFLALTKGCGHYENSVDSVYNITNDGDWTALDENRKLLENFKLFYIMTIFFNHCESKIILSKLEYFAECIFKRIDFYSRDERLFISQILDELKKRGNIL